MHKICFTISLFHAFTCFEHMLIIRRSKLHYTASGIITPISGCLVHGLREDRCMVSKTSKLEWMLQLLTVGPLQLWLLLGYVHGMTLVIMRHTVRYIPWWIFEFKNIILCGICHQLLPLKVDNYCEVMISSDAAVMLKTFFWTEIEPTVNNTLYIYTHTHTHTGCFRRNSKHFRKW